MISMTGDPGHGRLVVCSGVRAARDRLATEVVAQLDVAQGEGVLARPAALARPVWVLVPSRALRQQLLADWVQQTRRPLLGLRVETFAAAAAEVLRRSGIDLAPADALFPVLIQRALSLQTDLAHDVGRLRARASIVAASVADLLDAGLEDSSAEACEEALSGLQGEPARRARGVVRVALQVRRWLGALGWARPGDRLDRAGRMLDQFGAEVLPASRVWIYGVVDATGRLYDFLDAVVRTHDARIIVDAPPDPMRSGQLLTDYVESFVVRMGGTLSKRAQPAGEIPDPSASGVLSSRADSALPPARDARIEGICAAGAEGEVRAVAARVRAQLDAGCAPESIAVVARNLESYSVPLRTHFGRLGIPFSGLDLAGPSDPAGMRTLVVPELIRRGPETPLDRWLDALGYIEELGSAERPEPRRNPLRRDLATAFHALGLGRLRDLAELDLGERLGERSVLRLPGPARQFAPLDPGADALDFEEADGLMDSDRPPAAHVTRAQLELARLRAARLLRCFEIWGSVRSAADHARLLQRLLSEELGHDEAVPGFDRLSEAIELLFAWLPEDFELDRVELADALEQQLRARAATAFGGVGGGVQILEVTAARALAWESLFVLGLNRNVFPRVVSEDPLLPDSLRRALLSVLPELPIKARGHVEEEHLFAQLLSASARVTLAYQNVSDDGDERPASVLLRRYQLAHPGFRAEVFEPPLSLRSELATRPAFEHAVRAALHASGQEAELVLRLMLEDEPNYAVGAAGALLGSTELASARSAVVAALDTPPHRAVDFGGFLGRVGEFSSPREVVAITTLEGVARCPWQTFLRKVLRLQAPPDALDVLPALDPRWVGIAVHATFELIVARAASGSSHRRAPTFAVAWPSADERGAIILEACRRTLIDAGIAFTGLMRALAALVQPQVESAHALLWPQDGSALEVYGAEVPGSFGIERSDQSARQIHFRADLAVVQAGRRRWIDLKTGRPLSTAAKPDTRRKHLLQSVAKGTHLQALAYASAAAPSEDGPDGTQTQGAYVFLAPELPREHALWVMDLDDDELRRTFERTTRALAGAWESGCFFPRLIEPDRDQAPTACGYCEVAEACHQGDSGARLRLREVTKRATERAFLDVWQLPHGRW